MRKRIEKYNYELCNHHGEHTRMKRTRYKKRQGRNVNALTLKISMSEFGILITSRLHRKCNIIVTCCPELRISSTCNC